MIKPKNHHFNFSEQRENARVKVLVNSENVVLFSCDLVPPQLIPTLKHNSTGVTSDVS